MLPAEAVASAKRLIFVTNDLGTKNQTQVSVLHNAPPDDLGSGHGRQRREPVGGMHNLVVRRTPHLRRKVALGPHERWHLRNSNADMS